MADSHGKNLSDLIHQQATVNVCSFVRSGTNFNKVIEEVQQLTTDLTKNDYLLVIAGTNNVESTSVNRLMEDVHSLIRDSSHTNLILATLPMRHDKPKLDLKISVINSKLEKEAKTDKFQILPLHILPRHYYTTHGMHYNKKGKVKIAEMIVKMLSKNIEQPTNRTSGLSPDMGLIIDNFMDDSSVSFAHSVSGDLGHDRNMTAGVAVVFRKKIGRPQISDLKSDKLTFQKVSHRGACIYSLITKAMYNAKPTIQDYNDAFAQLTQDFKAKGLKKLICSPMGCVRDMIPPEQFAKNIVAFHQETGASVSIVCCDQVSQRELRRGLSHQEFILKLKESIEDGICNLSSAGGQDIECQDESVSVDSPPTSTQTLVDEKEDGAIVLKNEPPNKNIKNT
ncbi:hypothetical protein J6590_037296 [Homalodisca vitripennis]|nr:hypothetical protein J6590_037296 [Homalodisca vitripennis]